MRYFRMYVLVNIIVTGVMRAADTPQEVLHDTSAPPVDEEPPQKKLSEQDASLGLLNQDKESTEPIGSVETVPASLDTSIAKTEKIRETREVQEPEIQRPTLEDAETVIEGTHESREAQQQDLPLEPGVMPSTLPKTGKRRP